MTEATEKGDMVRCLPHNSDICKLKRGEMTSVGKNSRWFFACPRCGAVRMINDPQAVKEHSNGAVTISTPLACVKLHCGVRFQVFQNRIRWTKKSEVVSSHVRSVH